MKRRMYRYAFPTQTFADQFAKDQQQFGRQTRQELECSACGKYQPVAGLTACHFCSEPLTTANHVVYVTGNLRD